MKQVTVLTSGGLDSTVLLYYVVKQLEIDKVFALSFSYGQKHARELQAAVSQSRQFPGTVEHVTIDISDFGRIIQTSSALLAGGSDVPELETIDENDLAQPSTYVPNRNMVFLSTAAAFAESRNCREIYYAAQAHDLYSYWDCTPEFVVRLNEILALNRKHRLIVKAPFVNMRKSEVVELGSRLAVNFADTWSCYRGNHLPCGTCPTCRERAAAFAEAGVNDPLSDL